MKISLQASNVTSEYDPYSEKNEEFETDHIIAFEYNFGELRVLNDELKGEMGKYGNVNKLNDLIGVFQEKDLAWFWMDMFVTAEVEISNEAHLNELALTFLKYYSSMFGF